MSAEKFHTLPRGIGYFLLVPSRITRLREILRVGLFRCFVRSGGSSGSSFETDGRSRLPHVERQPGRRQNLLRYPWSSASS